MRGYTMNSLFDVRDKVVLITGSTRGIGYTLAKGFLDVGAKVIINGRDHEKTKRAAAELGENAFSYTFDVSDQKAVIKGIQQIEETVGPIDVLINNAGIQRRALLEELSEADWETVISVNLSSAFYVSQCVFKYMKKRSKGKVINITSLNAEAARPGIANYCAAKGGLKMLTKAMATEWGKYNIQTNAIGPGYFLTDLTEPLASDPSFDSWGESQSSITKMGKPRRVTWDSNISVF